MRVVQSGGAYSGYRMDMVDGRSERRKYHSVMTGAMERKILCGFVVALSGRYRAAIPSNAGRLSRRSALGWAADLRETVGKSEKREGRGPRVPERAHASCTDTRSPPWLRPTGESQLCAQTCT